MATETKRAVLLAVVLFGIGSATSFIAAAVFVRFVLLHGRPELFIGSLPFYVGALVTGAFVSSIASTAWTTWMLGNDKGPVYSALLGAIVGQIMPLVAGAVLLGGFLGTPGFALVVTMAVVATLLFYPVLFRFASRGDAVGADPS